jgi:hypothetical protein
MAEKQSPKSDRPSGDWFDGAETTDNQLPRVAIGDPSDPANAGKDTVILTSLEGTYEGTTSEMIDKKQRLLHQVLCRAPINGRERVAVWGNAQIDNSLPCLVPPCKVSFSYVGKRGLKGGKTMKTINVTYPANTQKRPNPFLMRNE